MYVVIIVDVDLDVVDVNLDLVDVARLIGLLLIADGL